MTVFAQLNSRNCINLFFLGWSSYAFILKSKNESEFGCVSERLKTLFVQIKESQQFTPCCLPWPQGAQWRWPRGICSTQTFCWSSCYDDSEKDLRSRSAASPGEISPLVTFCSRWGRVPLTAGWFWKCQRTFSWIRLHIQTFCWARRRPCSSPLLNMAALYASILAQTSGMPSKVWAEARTTWGGDLWGVGPGHRRGLKPSLIWQVWQKINKLSEPPSTHRHEGLSRLIQLFYMTSTQVYIFSCDFMWKIRRE